MFVKSRYPCGRVGLCNQQIFVLMKTSWRRLSFSSSKDVFKTYSRLLNKDKYILINHTSSEDVFKTSWSKPIYSSCPYFFKTFSRCFQDVLQKRLQDVLQIRLEDIFKTFWRRLKTSWRHLQGVFLGCLQDVFKTFVQVKLFFLTSLSLRSI